MCAHILVCVMSKSGVGTFQLENLIQHIFTVLLLLNVDLHSLHHCALSVLTRCAVLHLLSPAQTFPVCNSLRHRHAPLDLRSTVAIKRHLVYTSPNIRRHKKDKHAREQTARDTYCGEECQ
jgi:hypothetical protein